MTKLRYINLGDIKGGDLIAAMDLPTQMPFEGIIGIYGRITDEHFSVGTNRNIEDYLSQRKPEFTFSQYSSTGGVMYCKNMHLFRFCFDDSFKEENKRELSRSVAGALMKIIRNNIKEKSLFVEGNYIYLNNKKIGGFGEQEFKNTFCVYLFINKEKLPIEILRPLFKNKKFDNVMDLNSFNIPDIYHIEVVNNLAQRWGAETVKSSFSSEEEKIINNLKEKFPEKYA